MELEINADRISLDEAYMGMALQWAKRSKGVRLQVGAIIVKNQQICSDGYNGMPAKSANDVCEEIVDGNIVTKQLVLHAESNAILKMAKLGGEGCNGGTLYVTTSPCMDCCKLIIQAGIKRVVYHTVYRDDSSLKVLQEYGIAVDKQ